MNKKILHTIMTLAAALMLMGGFSMTAYAQSNEPQTEEVSAVVETVTPSDPLTPEGNATLVDDIYGENKQLITVTTKAGNYFYILIDRAAEGENTVHFLNMVDEADLMALLEDGEAAAEPEAAPETCICTEKCEAGAVNIDCPVCKNDLTKCTGKEAEPEAEPEQTENNNVKSLSLLFLTLLIGGGGAFYYFKFIKPKSNTKGNVDLDNFDLEDEESETEDEPEDTEDYSTDYTGENEDTEDSV